MFAEETGEIEQIIGVVRCRCEVAGRGRYDANALEEEVWHWSVTARAASRRATSGEARLALRGATGELVLVLGELYRAGCSDGLSS